MNATVRRGRIRVEDLGSAAATVCREACIEVTGGADPERHETINGMAMAPWTDRDTRELGC